MSIRLVIADSLPVIRAGLYSFFINTDIQIVDEATTGEQLIAKVPLASANMILLDTGFSDMSGFDAVERVRGDGYTGYVVFFSAVDQPAFYARAQALGADSYLLKKTNRMELIRILHAIVEAPSPLNSGELRHVSSLMKSRFSNNPLNPLTARETQVLRHVAFGLSNKEIASSLKVSTDTVKEHIRNILRKLNANDRTQAAVWAVKNHLF
ncbi:MAG: response regulator transcription factor [Thermoguttaceae bacterium]|nr:response regulator transcription factor [Thermoguttaceae bacterium]